MSRLVLKGEGGKRKVKKERRKRKGEREGEVLSGQTNVCCTWIGTFVCEMRAEEESRYE